jgi:GH35 family endo-1,4-beta-xylanase
MHRNIHQLKVPIFISELDMLCVIKHCQTPVEMLRVQQKSRKMFVITDRN